MYTVYILIYMCIKIFLCQKVQNSYLPLILEHLLSEVLLPLITLLETIQPLSEGQRNPLQKVPNSDVYDETEK